MLQFKIVCFPLKFTKLPFSPQSSQNFSSEKWIILKARSHMLTYAVCCELSTVNNERFEWNRNGFCHRFASSLLSSENWQFQAISSKYQHNPACQSQVKQCTKILVVFSGRWIVRRSLFQVEAMDRSNSIQSKEDESKCDGVLFLIQGQSDVC